MSALASRRSPRHASTFTTYAEVEVNIDPSELEREGWTFVGKDGTANEKALIVAVREMHEDEHSGPMRWCQHPVCREVVNER